MQEAFHLLYFHFHPFEEVQDKISHPGFFLSFSASLIAPRQGAPTETGSSASSTRLPRVFPARDEQRRGVLPTQRLRCPALVSARARLFGIHSGEPVSDFRRRRSSPAISGSTRAAGNRLWVETAPEAGPHCSFLIPFPHRANTNRTAQSSSCARFHGAGYGGETPQLLQSSTFSAQWR